MRWFVAVAGLWAVLASCPSRAVPAVSFSSVVNSLCPNPTDRQFVVKVSTKEPLGLRLSDKLEILEFLSDAQGRSRAVEASGLAEVRDRLIAVNNVSLVGMAFQSALTELSKATLPKELRFQTFDGRCMTTSTTSTASNTTTTTESRYDSVILSLGNKDSDQTFYAVLSAAGQPPSCAFRGVVVAEPIDACSPLSINATDRYVVVGNILGCPTHQKAAFVQEAGGRGIIFVQRVGEKPQQINVPADTPKPIVVPLVMVSYNSGWQLMDTIANRALPHQSPQLRFVFSEACTSDKFAVHPDEDPLQLSIVNRITSASAGFLSLTVAETAAKTLTGTSFEFLKPVPIDGSCPPLPLGQTPLFLTTGRGLNPCELRPDRQPANLVLWASEMEGSFVVVEYNPSACSLATHVSFFASKKVLGIIFADPKFPLAASETTARLAAQQASIPFVFVSPTSLTHIVIYGQDDRANHVLVEFSGENALQHQWKDLALISDAQLWPKTQRGRERLFQRMLKDQDALTRDEADHSLVTNERRDTLEVSFARAQQYFAKQREISVQV